MSEEVEFLKNYDLCVDNRIKGNYQEALKYYLLIKNNDELYQFHKEKIDYEMTILYYYCYQNEKISAAKFLINYLNQYSLNVENVWDNLKFYKITLKNLKDYNVIIKNLKTIDITNEFINSTPCKLITKEGKEILNVRYVNYKCRNLPANLKNFWGVHINDSEFSLENPVKTINFCASNEKFLIEENPNNFKKFPRTVLGLEDVRLFEKDNKIKFLATTLECLKYPDIRIATGDYDINNNKIIIQKIFDSPDCDECEKNWVMLNENEIIYKWSPVRIYDYDTLTQKRSYNVPKIFKYFRGSSNPINIGEFKYCLIHTVHYTKPRKYLHWIVKLNQEGYPLAYSTPFDFEDESIEYCLSMNYLTTNNNLEFHYSVWDNSSKSLEIPFEYFNDKFIEL